MEKDFGPYELAVKLKALGFDEPCITCYDKLEMIASHGKNVFDYKNYNTSGYMVSRPTFSQAFRWFREKYKINTHIGFKDYEDKEFAFYYYQIKGMKGFGFDTYEEAELACLTKLIEIVESKSE